MASAPEPAAEDGTIFNYDVETIDGEPGKVGDYARGKVSLVVNVASKCGFTSQYKDLQETYDTFKDRGFTILAFPCNQFGGQEPGSNEEVKRFACDTFGVTFPMFSKIEVNGDRTHPLFAFLKREKPGLLWSQGIKWNFTKFLVDSEGKPVHRFGPNAGPKSIHTHIEKLLPVGGEHATS